eukprot:8194353-Ditylum_brightwellii.AAC.1
MSPVPENTETAIQARQTTIATVNLEPTMTITIVDKKEHSVEENVSNKDIIDKEYVGPGWWGQDTAVQENISPNTI